MLKENVTSVVKKDTGGETAGKIKIKEEREDRQQERGTGGRMDTTITKAIAPIKIPIKIGEKGKIIKAKVRARLKGPWEDVMNAGDPITRKTVLN